MNEFRVDSLFVSTQKHAYLFLALFYIYIMLERAQVLLGPAQNINDKHLVIDFPFACAVGVVRPIELQQYILYS